MDDLKGPSNGAEPSTKTEPARPRANRRRSRIFVWLVVAVVVIAGVAAYGVIRYEQTTSLDCSQNPHCLVIDTYDTLFDSGADPGAARGTLFSAFENATGSTVEVNYISSDNLASVLLSEKGDLPDVVVGLDEITGPELDSQGLLVPYSPPELAQVPSSLVQGLAPDHTITPYEYGYLGLDYYTSLDNASGHALSQGDFFTALASNPSLASNFLYENPQSDITGEEFLLWEIEYYTHVLHQNWTTFFQGQAPPHGPVPAADWGSGFNEFSPTGDQEFVSYTTDPAYNLYFNGGGGWNTTVAHDNGSAYTWETIYGSAITKGVHDLALAQEFIQWMMGGTVQSLIPTNEWEYPANDTVTLPPVFAACPSPSTLTPLNTEVSPDQVVQNLTSWQIQWQATQG